MLILLIKVSQNRRDRDIIVNSKKYFKVNVLRRVIIWRIFKKKQQLILHSLHIMLNKNIS